MSEQGEPERKGWHAIAQEASAFYTAHGGESMNLEERARYEFLIRKVDKAAEAHDQAKG